MGQETTAGSGSHGASIVHHLARCLRLSTSYELSNAAVTGPIDDLVGAVNRAPRDGGTIAVQVVNDKFFLNKRFVRLDATAFEQARPLLHIFGRLGINEIAFNVVRLEGEQVRGFLETYKRYYASTEPAAI